MNSTAELSTTPTTGRRSARRAAWLAGAATVALMGLVAPAHAQTAAPVVVQPAQADDTASVDDVVVTARRRDEAIQDVPVAITAISGAALERQGITTVEQIRTSVPALQIAPSPFGPSVPGYTIRGQRQLEQLITQDPSVGVYVADVVQQRPHGTNSTLYDISSIQVLKGPQGTLFGRNTTGGAVLITPNRPTFEQSGSVTGLVGDYNLRGVNGYFNVPLSDTLALRIAGKAEYHDGYAKNLTNGEDLNDLDTESLRVSLLWQPNERFENYTMVNYYTLDDNGTAFSIFRLKSASNATALQPGVIAAFARQQGRDPLDVENSADTQDRTETVGVTNTTTIQFGDLTVKNIAGYRKVANDFGGDYDGSPQVIFDTLNTLDVEQYTDELQALGTAFDEKLNYIVGAYYFRERGYDSQISRVLGGAPSSREGLGENTSKSLFAQIDYSLTDKLSLTAGYRHSWDDRYVDLRSRTAGLTTCRLVVSDAAGAAPLNPCTREINASFDAGTYLVSLSYKLAPDVLVYASNSKGYRSGGLNMRASKPGEGVPFAPEEVLNYELGIKSEFFERRLRINAAAYFSDYSDIQRTVTLACADAPTTLCTTIQNAATAEVKGYEIEVTARPTPWLNLAGFVGYVDAGYTDFVLPTGQDLSGNKFALAPELTYGFNGEVNIPLSGRLGDLSLVASYYHADEQQLTDINDGVIPGYEIVNASVTWSQPNGLPIDIRAFVNNVFDERYYTSGVSLFSSIGTDAGLVGDPRTAGVSVTYSF